MGLDVEVDSEVEIELSVERDIIVNIGAPPAFWRHPGGN
jgi:hypothetical protein